MASTIVVVIITNLLHYLIILHKFLLIEDKPYFTRMAGGGFEPPTFGL